jgi:rhamnose utilization protein RhaD (predicted bifunctional aldolase and dehydrogenase)
MLKLLKDHWKPEGITDALELLRYRSNLLGADLRITNFGGGNTSSKIPMTDPFTGGTTSVLAVKGSGGDLGSIKTSGFALLYMDKLNQLKNVYRGEQLEDEMVAYYPLCAFGTSSAPASIDTPLHAFLPFPHVDHLHPDWAIAIAASANGKAKLEEFNRRFNHNVIWLPWQRPGFELGLMLQRGIETNPGCDGIILGSHGLFTWGDTQEECYRNSLKMIDDMGVFVQEHEQKAGANLFGGAKYESLSNAAEIATAIQPYLRGRVATTRRSIGHYDASTDVMQFVNSNQAPELAALGTSLPRPLHSHSHRAVVRRVGSQDRHCRTEAVDCQRSRSVSLHVHRVLQREQRNGVARAARRKSLGHSDSGRWHVHVRQEQEGSSDHG